MLWHALFGVLNHQILSKELKQMHKHPQVHINI